MQTFRLNGAREACSQRLQIEHVVQHRPPSCEPCLATNSRAQTDAFTASQTRQFTLGRLHLFIGLQGKHAMCECVQAMAGLEALQHVNLSGCGMVQGDCLSTLHNLTALRQAA